MCRLGEAFALATLALASLAFAGAEAAPVLRAVGPGEPGFELVMALRDGRREAAVEMIEAGVPVAVTARHSTPLLEAAMKGYTDVVRRLLEAGFPLGAEQPPPPALVQAASLGKVDVVALLAERWPAERAGEKHAALIAAARDGHPRTAGALVDAGADLEARDAFGRTPLMLAAAENHALTVRTLLGAGADVRARDPRGRTALMLASWRGQSAAADVLVDAGAEPAAEDERGLTALWDAGGWDHARGRMSAAWSRRFDAAWAEDPTPHAGDGVCRTVVSDGLAWRRGGEIDVLAWNFYRRPERGSEAWLLPLAPPDGHPPPADDGALRRPVVRVEDDPASPGESWRAWISGADAPALEALTDAEGRPAIIALWPAGPEPPRRALSPPPADLPWGAQPENVEAALDVDRDGHADAALLGACCGDPLRGSAEGCEYTCGATFLRDGEGWKLCLAHGPA